MKKYVSLLLAIFIFLFSSCDTEGDSIDVGYYSYSISFFYPENISNNYEFAFNGEKGSSGYVFRNNSNGLLEVYEKDNSTLVFSKQISLADDSSIQLIKLGDDIVIYSKDDYISFIPTVIYSGNSSDYSIWFNDQELENATTNYLSKQNLTGTFQIKKSGVSSPIYSQEITIADGEKVNFMQLSDTEVLNIPEDDEPEPTDQHIAKARFFYTSDVLNTDEIRMDFYRFDENSWDWASELSVVSSVTLKKGELSEYVELNYLSDGAYISYMCDITDLKTGTKITDYMSDYIYVGAPNKPSDDGTLAIFKKVTYQILNGGKEFTVMDGLTTRW
ncbi:MAG: hypothetical protein H6Q13_2148 [Bacteroidetes bacterium]|nr:hypothetical protein [Bacteroidota bacterium]